MKGKEKSGQLVDLATNEMYLEDEVIRHYPGKITGEQHLVDDSEPGVRIYRFFNLDRDELLRFLGQYKNLFKYEVRDSQTGRLLAAKVVHDVSLN